MKIELLRFIFWHESLQVRIRSSVHWWTHAFLVHTSAQANCFILHPKNDIFFRPDIFIGFCGILNKTKAYQGLTLGTLAVHEFYQCVCDLRFTGEPMHYKCVYDLRFTSEPMHYSEYRYTYIEFLHPIIAPPITSCRLHLENWSSVFCLMAWNNTSSPANCFIFSPKKMTIFSARLQLNVVFRGGCS